MAGDIISTAIAACAGLVGVTIGAYLTGRAYDMAVCFIHFHQMDGTFDARIFPSRLITGTPRHSAVAATMRSAGHLLHRSNDVAGKWRFLEHMLGVVEGAPQIIEGRCRQTVLLFEKVDDFREADGRNLYRLAIGGGPVDEVFRRR